LRTERSEGQSRKQRSLVFVFVGLSSGNLDDRFHLIGRAFTYRQRKQFDMEFGSQPFGE
jgi:hypothetical protein